MCRRLQRSFLHLDLTYEDGQKKLAFQMEPNLVRLAVCTMLRTTSNEKKIFN